MKLLPWKLRDYLDYHKIYGKYPNLKQPKTMNEKVLYRKRQSGESKLFTMLADKYLVRDYVAKRVGEEYLIPLIACLDNVAMLEENLVNYQGCVIKPNHGSRMVAIVPVNPTQQEIDKIIQDVKKWMKTDYSHRHGELQYKNIERKILIEAFIGDRKTLPTDYKFHTFKQPDNTYKTVLEVIRNRAEKRPQSTFFIDGFTKGYSGDYQIPQQDIASLEQAEVLSTRLLGELEYARVDWYLIDDKLYFGEITLMPGAGLDKDLKGELDMHMSALWHLELAADS